ncbi:hypothetical protein JCM10296v2_006923 [Rhodotorula toruloides]
MRCVVPSDGTASLIGVGIAVIANIVVSLALNVQRLAHLKRAHRDERPTSSPHPKSPSRTLPRSSERTPLIIRTRPTLDSIPSEQGTSQGGLGGKHRTPEVLVLPVESDFASRQRSFSPSKRRTSGPRTDKGFLKSKLWLLGFFLMAAGELGNFLAYGFAPPSVVAPLGMVALIANVFLPPVIVREPFRKKDLVGVGIAIIGGATVVYASRQRDVKLTPSEFVEAVSRPLFIAYAVVCTVAMSALAYFSRTKAGDRFVLVDLSLCAIAGAFTVLSAKALSSFLNLIFLDSFKYAITYAVLLSLALSAFLQLNYLQKSLQRFESRAVIPTQFTTFSLSTIVGSAILYRDFEGVGLPSLVKFVFGCLICAAGVYLLTRDSPNCHLKSSATDSAVDSFATDSAHASQGTPSVSSVSSQPSPRSTQTLAVPDARAGPGRRRRKLSVTLGGAYLLAATC